MSKNFLSMAWAILVLLLTRETAIELLSLKLSDIILATSKTSAAKSPYDEIFHKDREDLSLLTQSRQVGVLTITRLHINKNGVSIDLGISLNKAVSNK